MRRSYRLVSILIAAAVMLACVPTLKPASTQAPVFDPNSINTAIVLTANAAATQTALLMPPTLTPTVTSPPTSTLPPSETPTPTFIFILPTSTVPSATPTPEPTQESSGGSGSDSGYASKILSQSPANNTTYAPGASFNAAWEVKNTGNGKWDAASADYRYVSGDKIHQAAIYDFSKSIGVGKSTLLLVSMKAPDTPGNYSTTWKIVIGKSKFCPMKLTITVQ